MTASTAIVPTKSASRYLQQLCKHWSHKLDVAFTAEAGTIRFPSGNLATLTAAPDTLTVRVDLGEGGDMTRFKGTIQEHLDRFAFREAPLPFDWRDA